MRRNDVTLRGCGGPDYRNERGLDAFVQNRTLSRMSFIFAAFTGAPLLAIVTCRFPAP
jgi:hypothetical protein